MRKLTLLIPLFLLVGLLPAQSPIASTPATLGQDAGAWLFYDDGSAEFATVDEGGLTATKISTSNSDRDTQSLVTRWKSNGLDQEVITTFGGKTQGAREAAVERHASAVALQLEAFPKDP